MAGTAFDIISIGTLARNRLWKEPQEVRTAHATTTLVRTGRHSLLIDPGLPAVALNARLFERTGLGPEKIDRVFLTTFHPAHRSGLGLFTNARTYIAEAEQRAWRERLEGMLREAPDEDLDRQELQRELDLLESIRPAEDQLDEHADLFPLPGYTTGSCGVLLSLPMITVLIAGAAIATQEHFLAGQVLPDAQDLTAAKVSLQEAYEIADLVVPGYDNVNNLAFAA